MLNVFGMQKHLVSSQGFAWHFACKFCILFFIVFGLNAKTVAEEVLPAGCSAVVVKDDVVNLPKNKAKFVFIHNLSENNLWLVRQVTEQNSQVVLSSKMGAGTWSALILGQNSKDIKFSCIESKPGHEQKISCQDVLAICQWPHTKIPEDIKDVFFLAENMDLSGLSAYSERNGYSLS